MLHRLRPPTKGLQREWWWLALAWLVLGVLLALDLWQEHVQTEKRERQYLAQQAHILHDNLSGQLQAIDRVLQSIVLDAPRALAADSATQARFHERLSIFSDALTGVRSLSVLDAHGKVLASSREDMLGVDLSQRAYFQTALAQAQAAPSDPLLVSSPFSALRGGTVIVLARALRTAQEGWSGLVVATLDPQEFARILASLRYTPDMLVGLAHGDGTHFVLLSPPLPASGAAQPDTPWSLHRASGSDLSVLRGPVTPGGPDYLLALRTIAPAALHMDQPLIASIGRDTSALWGPWRTRMLWTLASYLLSALAAAAMLQRMQRHWHRLQHQETQLQERWQAVLEATSQGVWDWDLCTGQRYYSPAWMAMMGLPPESLGETLQAWQERIHPQDRLRVQMALEQHLQGTTALYEATYRVRHADGHYLWMSDRGRVVGRTPDGQPLRLIGAQMDVSAQQEQQALLARLAQNVPGMIYQLQIDTQGRSSFPYASKGVLDIYEYSPEFLQDNVKAALERIHPEDRERVRANFLRCMPEPSLWCDEYRVVLPQRGERWVSAQARPERQPDGSVLWYGYIHDITEAKEQALKLEETERVLKQLMTDMPVGLCMIDETHHMYFRNHRFIEYFGYTETEVATLHQWALKAYPDSTYREQVARLWKQAKAQARTQNGRISTHTYRISARDGTQRVMEVGGLQFGQDLLITFQDRTEQQAQNELLHKLAYMDGLTGIANRRHFDQTLAAEWRRCRRSHKPLSLIMLDIDHFKRYNDHYGHAQGDACLRAVAQTLRTHLGRSHDLVARYGGEEFVCLLPECDLQGASHKAHLLRMAVQALGVAHAASPVASVVTASLGVACCIPHADNTPEELLHQADAQLYRAKGRGRNQVATADDIPL